MRGYFVVALLAATTLSLSATGKTPVVTLGHNGFSVGAKHATFDRTTKADAIALASAALGRPTASGSHGDCGQGDIIGFAKFRGNFELSFVKGKLSGWTEDSTKLATDKGIRVGDNVAALRKAYSDVFTDAGDEANGGLGPSFQSETGPAGWLDGVKASSKIVGMFAGATCLSGV